MITSLVKKQLIVFWSAAAVAGLVLAMVFLRVPEALGVGRYVVEAEFAEAAGLYDGAQVNFRGSLVGKVTDLRVEDRGITAEMTLQNGVEIPAGVRAEVHSMSAVGEQYVELVPVDDTANGALGDGDVIPVERTTVPVEIGPVLDHVDSLVRSVPQDDLDTVLEEAARAMNQRDGDLQAILDGSAAILSDAREAFGPTRKLIEGVDPLLSTVNSRADNLDSLTRNLAQVTTELRAGDSDLRALLADGPAFAAETTDLISDLQPVIPALLGPLRAVASVLETYQAHIGQLLSDYPVALAVVQSVNADFADEHQISLTVSNINKPGECSKGFLPASQWQSPLDETLVDPQLLWCSEEATDPRAVRGARNIPCAENPARRAPTVWFCRN
jgi:phospholipid/cholesterol/gamma-HCH transport system substrate-binding protein